MEAKMYLKSMPLQVRDGQQFMELCSSHLGWGKGEGGGSLMDIGCGPGNNSTKALLDLFPLADRIIAIDASEDMIALAKTQNPNDKVEYVALKAEDRQLSDRWASSMDKVLSTFTLHWVKVPDHLQALKNIYGVLKDGGEAALFFLTAVPLTAAHHEIIKHPLWKEYIQHVDLNIPMAQPEVYDIQYYRKTFQDIGFEIVLCKDDDLTYTYEFDIFKGFIVSMTPHARLIPQHMRPQFEMDLATTCVKYYETTADGRVVASYKMASVLLRKPKKK